MRENERNKNRLYIAFNSYAFKFYYVMYFSNNSIPCIITGMVAMIANIMLRKEMLVNSFILMILWDRKGIRENGSR